MKSILESLAAWIIGVAVLTPFFHFSFWLTLTLAIFGSILWLVATTPRPADILTIITTCILALAFTLPIPLPDAIPAPLQLALIVGGWSAAVVFILYIANRFWKK